MKPIGVALNRSNFKSNTGNSTAASGTYHVKIGVFSSTR